MFKYAHTKVGVGTYVIQAWDADTNLFFQNVLTKENKDDVSAALAQKFGKQADGLIYAIKHFLFQINAQSLAGQIPKIHEVHAKHPVTGQQNSLYAIIIDLNDSHGWTREKIADWLDTLPDQPKFTPPEIF